MPITAPLRYGIVGTGHRSEMYVGAILGPHADTAELVVLADNNPTRARFYAEHVRTAGGDPVLANPDDIAAVIAEHRLDRVIITTPDRLHAHFIDTVLRAGADVVVEKPLTIDADGCRRIATAVRETGRNVVVTFNYRYSPRNTALKQLISSGAIGRVTAVHFEWVLDTAHGADYFRRWHREKSNSGGLLIHKASHHFDLVNWWIDDSPARIFASGGLRFYGEANARDRGVGVRPERGTHDGPTDPFQLDLRGDDRLRRLYLEAEGDDGYRRDLDVFSPGITIEDTLSLVVEYDRGVSLSYSLVAYGPWEGYRVSVTGTEGRAELDVVERAAVIVDDARVLDPSFTEDAAGGSTARERSDRLVLQRHWARAEVIEIPSGEGGHGGGDELLLADVFRGAADDPLGRPATWIDGVRAVAVGIAGNESLHSHASVSVADLDLGVDLFRR